MIAKAAYERACTAALAMLDTAGIALTTAEKAEIEVADFGLNDFDTLGLSLITYVNTERCCAKELLLTPWQICPEHRHPPLHGLPGKEETFRCRWGTVYLYVDCIAQKSGIEGRVPEAYAAHFTTFGEVILTPGEQYTLPPNTLHWFQGGAEGAIVSEFSTRSMDESDIYTDPAIRRIPEVEGA